jgi:hypothetical protein
MPPYDVGKFVNRQEEIHRTMQVVERLRQNDPQGARTLIFQGERGSGKSWLSFHLHRTILAEEPDVISLLVCLFPRPEGQESQTRELFIENRYLDPDAFTERITRWVGKEIGAVIPEKASLRELTGWLTREVERQTSDPQTTQQRILVLILDSVFEADWKLLKQLEDYLLAPLAALPRVLIIMSGRGRLYSWESPYLRVDVDRYILDTFEEDQIREQLRLQMPDREADAAEIMKLANGYPGANVLLAYNKNQPHGYRLSSVVNELLKVVDDNKRPMVREYLEALCVLEGFRDEEIPIMLAAYHGEPVGKQQASLAEVRTIRNMLLETHLVRWENRQYQIDRPICSLLRNVLLQDKHELWIRLQCQAYCLYKEWSEKFARGHEHFLARAEFHAQQLRGKGVQPEQCPDILRAIDDPSVSQRPAAIDV